MEQELNEGNGGPSQPGTGFLYWVAKREPLITFTFFIILSILSFTTVYTSRQTETTISKTNTIANCTTPGTSCYDFTQQLSQQRLKETKASAFCIVDTITAYPLKDWQQHRDELLTAYNQCVATASK